MARGKDPIFTDFQIIRTKSKILCKANLKRGIFDQIGIFTIFFILPAFIAAFLSSIVRMPLIWLGCAGVCAYLLMRSFKTYLFGITLLKIDTKTSQIQFPIDKFHVPLGDIEKIEIKDIPLKDTAKTTIYGMRLEYKEGFDIPAFFFTTKKVTTELIKVIQQEQKKK